MTTNASFDERLSAWLLEESEHRVPDHLREVLEVTAPMRQRAWWSSPERWLPMDLTSRVSTLVVPRFGRLLLVGLLILALAALVVVAVGSGQQRLPPPFGLAANGAILSSINGDIYLADANGTGLHTLITGPDADFGPWYSHDGTRFAFWRDAGANKVNVMMANADGSNVRQVTKEALVGADWYEWSPADDQLAIVHGDSGSRVISVLDVATGALHSVEVPSNVDSDLLWRPPNGQELVFTARAELGSPKGAAIYGIRPDGTGLRTIVPERSEDWTFLNVDLSPDGRTLTYWMYEADPGAVELHARVHLVDLETGADRVVRFDPVAVEESELHFSPDGKLGTIVEATDQAHFAIVDVATTRLVRRVGPAFAGNESKATGFSPDGTTAILAFENRAPFLIDVTTGEVRVADAAGSYGSWQRLASAPTP
jgi:Tol biopolymer transport system component